MGHVEVGYFKGIKWLQALAPLSDSEFKSQFYLPVEEISMDLNFLILQRRIIVNNSYGFCKN